MVHFPFSIVVESGSIASAMPSAVTISVRMLDPRATAPRLGADDVLFWRNDLL
jgi:hypothetical protein